jgi:hypothetical protein
MHALKKAAHYKEIDFMIEERLRNDLRTHIVNPSIPLIKTAIQQLAKEKDESNE